MSIVLRNLKIGDRDAFQELFVEFYAPLVSFAIKLVSDKGTAEDIVQEVFIKIWEGMDKIAHVNNISAYLYQAVRYSCYNYKRNNKIISEDNIHLAEDVEMSSCIEEMIIEEESFRLYLNEMEKLPPKCRKIFSSSLDGLLAKEIAEELNISIETVKTQKKIALRKLREKFKQLLIFLFLS